MPRLRLAVPLAWSLLAGSALAAGCATSDPMPPASPSGAAVRKLGQSFRTRHGDVTLIRVQDEYHLLRSSPTGAIGGMYEDVFTIARDAITDDASTSSGVRWNHWVPVPLVPGLDIMFLSPEWIALREQIAAAPVR